MAESLADYIAQAGVKTQYLHADVDTVERIRILKDLRQGVYDVVVGINLLREGLDLPEVSLIAILDADKEGFLRSSNSLIQIIGRAARNVHGLVVLYADKMTPAMQSAIDETNRRRTIQVAHNTEHGITPRTIEKRISDITEQLSEQGLKVLDGKLKQGAPDALDALGIVELTALIAELEAQMLKLAELLEFEKAALLRDQVKELNNKLTKKMKSAHVGTRGKVG
jgi:excinuclease ABC subunit B